MIRPESETVRLILVLSAVTGVAYVPMSMTAIVPAAPRGSLNFCGILWTGLLMRLTQRNTTGFVMYFVDTYKVMIRKTTAAQTKNGVFRRVST